MSDYLGFNITDIVNVGKETAIKMLDKFTRIRDDRRIQPLDRYDNVYYKHRYLSDDNSYHLVIGDTYFMIPPEFIMVSSDSPSQSIVTLRQENTQKIKSGYHKRIILIDLVFNGIEQLNGYKVEGPESPDKPYYVDGLRQLLAQFKCTPFLPISNELINGMYGIYTVALQSITMSTMEGFPDVMTAQITLQEVNMFPYIQIPDAYFKDMIDWDLFRYYYQRLLTEERAYKKLRSLPSNKEHNKFKLSILDESVFSSQKATRYNMLEIIRDEKIVNASEDDSVKTNYTEWINSDIDNVVISSFQCGYSNILTNIQLSDSSSPTVQFMGGMDTIYNIVFETTDYSVVQALEQCQMTNNALTRGNKKLNSVGFVKLESELVEFTGSQFVVIESVTTNTVPGFPGLYNVQMHCVAYDIAQSEREDLKGFLPFECNKDGRCGVYENAKYDADGKLLKEGGFVSDHVHDNQAITQTMEGLKIKIKQDVYAEWKLRNNVELYPDLHLPTYNEVDEVITKIRNFREKNNMTQLDYTKYPKAPVYTLQCVNPDNKISFNYENSSNTIIDISSIDDSLNEYNGFVDPDFYVFYPNSYYSLLEEDKDCYNGYTPKERQAVTKTKTITRAYENNSNLMDEFIAEAKKFIGHSYVWGAEGEEELWDDKGETFDCSGFVTYLLKKIGVMPVDQPRFTVSTMHNTGLFDEVAWDKMQKGDLLLTIGKDHVVIYQGNNQIIHASNEAPYPKGGIKEDNLYFHEGYCLRPKAFFKESVSNSSNLNTNIDSSGFYVTDEFLEIIKQSEGFLGSAEPRDGGIDIGYGFHNEYFDGTKQVKIQYGMTMTKEEAHKYLKLEMEATIPMTLAKLKENGWDTTQFTNNQILALTSYFYNRGYYNPNADKLLYKSNSATINDIGNNLPAFWGQNAGVKKGLINRRNKEKEIFFTEDNSIVSDTSKEENAYILTTSEFESICRVIMAETQGEPPEIEKAIAQVIYDRLTYPNKKFGGLSNILESSGQFKTPYKGELSNTIEHNVISVFCNNDRYWPDNNALYFLTPDSTTVSFKDRDSNCNRIGEIGTHVFWGTDAEISDIKYIITDGLGTSGASGNTYSRTEQLCYNVSNATIDKFGQPVFIRSDGVMHDDVELLALDSTRCDIIKKELNSEANIYNSAFCDEVQYSGRGRLLKAFPTYLFCILDDQAQWYDGKKLWTNYYVHKSVVDIAVHATNDMPTETATIVITNSYHNLDRTQGGLSSYNIYDDDYYSSFQKWWYKTTSMMPFQFGPKLTDKLIELHQVICDHALLREGARVHLRMGYGSDPLSLAPVMNGHISDVSLGDQISMVISSDGHELIQNITSANEKDTNNGFLGLFGLGEQQESSNVIAEVICKRQSWVTHLMGSTFEGSKYSMEHYGLYFNKTIMRFLGEYSGKWAEEASDVGRRIGQKIGLNIPVVSDITGFLGSLVGGVGGTAAGLVVEILDDDLDLLRNTKDLITDIWDGHQEQYDLLKNIYKANYKKQHYIYTTVEVNLFGAKDEQNLVFNKYNMTPWDVLQVCTQQVPEYIVKSTYHQFDSRIYFGLPSWMEKFRYDYINGKIFEECKTASQVHFLDSMDCIIDNQIKVTSKFSNTNIKVMYTRGSSPTSTQTIHSDDTIDFSKQKTSILDSPICQDALGPDAIYELLSYNIGEESARRIGISNLLYGWQQQYQGQLLLMGHPGLKPHDFMMINDTFANLYGLSIVREVTHSFNTNTGFTTSVVPGMVGFSTDENSGMIETSKNYLSLLNCFSSFTQVRKNLRDNYEKNIGMIADIEKAKEELAKAVHHQKVMNIHLDVASVLGNVVAIHHVRKAGIDTFRFAKNLHNMKKTGELATTFVEGYKTIDGAIDFSKGVRAGFSTLKTGKNIKSVISAGKGIKNTISGIKAGTTAVAGGAGGWPALIVAAVWVAVDILLQDFFMWLSNKNVCALLPMWWEGYPFVAGVKDGEKILLTDSNSVATNDNTREDRIIVEDN